MILTFEQLIKKLETDGYTKRGDICLLAEINPSNLELFTFGYLFSVVASTQYVLNIDDEFITIIPIDKLSAKPITEEIKKIPVTELHHIKISKGMLTYQKYSLFDKDDKCLFAFEVLTTTTGIVYDNLKRLIDKYPHEGDKLFKVSTLKLVVIFSSFIALAIFFLYGGITGIIDGDLSLYKCVIVILMGLGILGLFIFALYKKLKSKQ